MDWLHLRSTSGLAQQPVRCAPVQTDHHGGVPCVLSTSSRPTAFEVTSKRRKGFRSEARVKRGDRVVGGSKELLEKLGRNDPCPCGSGRRFQALLHAHRSVRWLRPRPLFLGNRHGRVRVAMSRALPNISVQRPVVDKVHVARTHHALGVLARARIARPAVVELTC